MVSFVYNSKRATMTLTNDQKRYLEEWMNFLKFHQLVPIQLKKRCRQAAEWVKNALENVGVFIQKSFQQKDHPIVYGEHLIDSKSPHGFGLWSL